MKNDILEFLRAHESEEFTFIDIARALRISPQYNKTLTKKLRQLVEENSILFDSKFGYRYAPVFKKIKGHFKLAHRNFAFIEVAEDEDSFYVGKENFNGAFDNYEVEANVYQNSFDERTFAVVTKILKKPLTTILGTIKEGNGFLKFEPFNIKYSGYRYFWDSGEAQSLLKIDDVIKIRIENIKGDRIYFSYLKTVSHESSPFATLDIILESFEIENVWNDEVKEELKSVPLQVLKDDLQGRKDLRNKMIVTIDGESTKDFDDAISVHKEGDLFVLGVYIADVSYYVHEDSQIDKEALKRGTSIYLPHEVIPMLPEELSNGICSLNPHVDRLILGTNIYINQAGKTIKKEIFEGVINSKHRLTYKAVNEYYQGTHDFQDQELHQMLNDAHQLSEILLQAKLREGFIDFEIEEAKVILDDEGKTQEIVVAERGFSEVLIENFMVRANETVASEFSKLKLPSIYRIHLPPASESLQLLNSVLKLLGISARAPISQKPHDFAKMVLAIKEEGHLDDFIKVMLLRTMQKAIYSEDNFGHFGLASKAYSHFTSPIRRYPDLLLHRLTKALLLDAKNKEVVKHFHQIISQIANHSSETEQVAVSIERQITDVKKAEYYEKFVNQKFRVQIVSILNFGMFVEFENKTSAMIHVNTMSHDIFKVNENKLSIDGKKGKYKLGDFVEIVIVKVDSKHGKIDAVLSQDWEEYNKKMIALKNRRRRY